MKDCNALLYPCQDIFAKMSKTVSRALPPAEGKVQLDGSGSRLDSFVTKGYTEEKNARNKGSSTMNENVRKNLVKEALIWHLK